MKMLMLAIFLTSLSVGVFAKDKKQTGYEKYLKGNKMVLIPAGTYKMGDRSRNYKFEMPVHTVSIKAFRMSQYEVTFEQYDMFATATGRQKASDGGWGRGKRPVINITWNDAVAYTRWLSKVTGKRFRLPTEAEWEYAARGGVDAENFSTGDCITTRQANFTIDWSPVKQREYKNTKDCPRRLFVRHGKTVKVGSYSPNQFGLYDMHGNVSEMVLDCWKNNYLGHPTDGSALITGDGCGSRVMRGGSWYDPMADLRSAYRHGIYMPYKGVIYTRGFRIVLELGA